MSKTIDDAKWDRAWHSWLAPYPLFAGVVLSFLTCSYLGRLASRDACFQDVPRFHQATCPETLFYPTSSQIVASAVSQLDTDQIAVVIGGDSLLRGVGQREHELWSKHLQKHLGARYRVINLAMNGALFHEFGMTCAEMIKKKHERTIFVTQFIPGLGAPPFGKFYEYFHWDARAKGLLPHNADRERYIQDYVAAHTDDETFGELQRQMAIDSWTYSRDLWTWLAYNHFSTVWNPLVQPFHRPRRLFNDNDPGPLLPFEQRMPPHVHDQAVSIIRELACHGKNVGLLSGKGPLASYPEFEKEIKQLLSPSLHDRTLILVIAQNPYYAQKLAPQELKDYMEVSEEFAHAYKTMGFSALSLGQNWEMDDFNDRCHLSESGGRKLAAVITPAIQDMASRLGYLNGGGK